MSLTGEGRLGPVDLGIDGILDISRIGQGSYGTVYRATQPAYRRTVAVKVLTLLFADDDARRRFERECQALGSLSGDPHIVTLYSAGLTSDGHPYLIMDYMSGGSLAARVSASGPMAWPEATDIGVKLAGALAIAHAQGVLHRDIKPENVLFSSYGEPQLADFGVARIQGGTTSASGTITGSLAHAAPEVISGVAASESSDVWSLASTVFTLLAGAPPFHRDTDETLTPLITRILTEPPTDLRPMGVPTQVCEVLEAALAKDSWERTPRATAFGTALQQAQSALGVTPTAMAVPVAAASPESPAEPTPTPDAATRIRAAATPPAKNAAMGQPVDVAPSIRQRRFGGRPRRSEAATAGAVVIGDEAGTEATAPESAPSTAEMATRTPPLGAGQISAQTSEVPTVAEPELLRVPVGAPVPAVSDGKIPPPRAWRSRRAVLAVAVLLALVVGGSTVALTRNPGGTSIHLAHTSQTTAHAANRSGSAGSTTSSSPTSSTAEPNQTFATLYRNDVSGVVRIDASTCGGSGVGSGFLISPTLVATAAHVVDGAVAIGLTTGTNTLEGHVVGVDDQTDVALIQAAVPLQGHLFSLATEEPPVGTQIGVIGYPEGGPVSFTEGSVSGLDRSIPIAGQTRSGLLQTDAALNPGDSGGPLLLLNDTVAGLADAVDTQATGIGYAVPVQVAAPLFSQWEAGATPPPPPSCTNPLGPSTPEPITGGTNDPNTQAAMAMLNTYFTAINHGDYQTAYALFSPDAQKTISEAKFAVDDATTFDYNITLQAVTSEGPGRMLADVTFTSLQRPAKGPNGDSCDHWTLQYTLIQIGSVWRIEVANGQGGQTHSAC
jgi:S1-C subfamily serine protease